MYSYYSLADDWAEPLLIESTFQAAAKHGIRVKIKSWKNWSNYRRSLKLQTGGVIFSTHGSPKRTSSRKPKQWEFSSLRRNKKGRRTWYTMEENFSSDAPINAKLLIVFACNADDLTWGPFLREGSFAVVSKGEINTAHCAAALDIFWDRVPNLNQFDLTYDKLRAQWPDLDRFEVVAGTAAGLLTSRRINR